MESVHSFLFFSMFELQPDAKALFDHMEGEDIRKNPRFKAHAISLVDTIDQAIACLGPDLDVLKQDLKDLGRRHFSFGVDSGYLPIMERSVLHAIEELTNGNLTDEDRKAWKALFTFILDCMMEGMSA